MADASSLCRNLEIHLGAHGQSLPNLAAYLISLTGVPINGPMLVFIHHVNNRVLILGRTPKEVGLEMPCVCFNAAGNNSNVFILAPPWREYSIGTVVNMCKQ